MKPLKYLIVSIFLVPLNIAFAGQEAGNGGFIDGLIQAELEDKVTLTNAEINKLVESRGLEIKLKLITPLFEHFLAIESNELNEQLRVVQEELQSKRFELFEDIKVSHIKIGKCNGATTCTGGDIFSSIVIDTESIDNSTYGVSFSELIGLLTHEYLHHFYNEVPNHDKYYLARYIKNTLLKGEYNEKKYFIKDLVWHRGGYSRGGWKYLFQGEPNDFCKLKGHLSGAKNYEEHQLTLDDVSYLSIYYKWRNPETALYYTVKKNLDDVYVVGEFGKKHYTNIKSYRSITCFSK